MLKVAIVVLADTENNEGLGRVVNAMEAVKEFAEAGDEVRLIFDGAGAKWVGELTRSEHPYHELYAAVRDRVSGVCEYCAAAFGVTDAVRDAQAPMAAEYEGHPSFRRLLLDGFHDK